MNGELLVKALHGGRRVYGSMLTSPSPHWLEAVRSAELDLVFIDTEHIPLDRTAVAWMCQAFRAAGIAPIVRIPEPDPFRACMVLDGGASGVIAPYIETAAQVRSLVGAVKYRPLKGRMLKEALQGSRRLDEPLAGYLSQRNSGNALVVNIESQPALEALDDILSVDGLDGVLIGPHDLSCSLGVPEQYSSPEMERAMRTIITKARTRGLGAGVHLVWDGNDQEKQFIEWGANLIVHSADFLLFRDAIRARIRSLKAEEGEGDPSADDRPTGTGSPPPPLIP